MKAVRQTPRSPSHIARGRGTRAEQPLCKPQCKGRGPNLFFAHGGLRKPHATSTCGFYMPLDEY